MSEIFIRASLLVDIDILEFQSYYWLHQFVIQVVIVMYKYGELKHFYELIVT